MMDSEQMSREAARRRAVLRLFRGAVGHEPAHGVLRPLLEARCGGAELAGLARDLLTTPTGKALHGGPEGAADSAFVNRAIAAAAQGRPSSEALALAPGLLGQDRAAALAILAETPLFRDDGPDLPALYADRRPDDPAAYRHWQRLYEPTDPPRRHSALPATVIVPVGDTTLEAAVATADSLAAQSHAAWRLTLAGAVRSPWAVTAAAAAARRPGVTLTPAPAWTALRQADGAFALLLSPGDRLAPDALGHLALAFDEDPAAMLVYADEDMWLPNAGRVQPRFKTAFSPLALEAGNVLGRMVAYRTAALAGLFEAHGPAWPETASAAWELAAAATRRHPGGVRHIPRVLLHAANPPRDWPAAAAPRAGAADTGSVQVSVIIPTRDRPDLLRAVTDGVLRRTAHRPHELILVDHATTDPDAGALLDTLAAEPGVRVLRIDGPFNFAAMNNRAAALATGEVLLLLNNDIEIRDPAWLSHMLALALRPEIGLVGARLLWRDGRLQHGGIALGPEGRATHLFRGAPRDDPGYDAMLAVARDVGAVTGACIAIRREIWRDVGGMDEGFPVAWNDIDLCQRVRRAGLRVVWTPHAVLTHLEGETRGSDAEPRALAAFLADGARYRAIWGDAADVDPFLNPNLIATDNELCLAPPRLPKPSPATPLLAEHPPERPT